LNVWFIRGETEEALGIPMEAIRDFLRETILPEKEELRCTCGKPFRIAEHNHPLLIKQAIQWSNHEKSHKYHSACLFVQPQAFPNRTYLGKPADSSEEVKQAELPRRGQRVGSRRRQKVDSRQMSMF
ncbi:unnamed protein product, partial [marine sediment metagenome]